LGLCKFLYIKAGFVKKHFSLACNCHHLRLPPTENFENLSKIADLARLLAQLQAKQEASDKNKAKARQNEALVVSWEPLVDVS